MQRIRCYRHDDGKPFDLWKQKDSLVLENSEMEARLSERLMRMPMVPAVFVCPRRDATFLECSEMAKVGSVRTIFAIEEDSQSTQISIESYRAEKGIVQEECKPNAPHSEWRRSSSYSYKDSNDSTKIHWIDLRRFQTEIGAVLVSEAGAVEFFRSVLSVSHEASPWNPTKPTEFSPDIVALVFHTASASKDESDFSILQNFRVSDAAPSWFLHSFAFFEHLEDSLSENFRSQQDPISSREKNNCCLMVYKKLDSRPILHPDPPGIRFPERDNLVVEEPSSSILLKGCLWQEYSKDITEDCKEKNDSGTSVDETNDPQNSRSSDDNPIEGKSPSIRYRLVSPPYLNLDEEYPHLFANLFSKEALRVFTEDALSIPQWTPWPETAHYKTSKLGNEKPWTVFPLCHCFPANQPENFTWIEATKAHVPRTCQWLEDALALGNGRSYLRTALFSQMAPRSVLEEHSGWAELANHVLRLHIPLVVPNDGLCGTWVDGCVETHAVGRPILFDDSKIHRAFNYGTGDRIVLIVDLARPKSLPVGTGSGGRTEELNTYIQRLSTPK